MSSEKSDFVIGVMSGSSIDALDIAICELSGIKDIRCELRWSKAFPFPMKIKESLLKATSINSYELFNLESRFSEFVAHCINKAVGEFGHGDYIADHGHTIFHEPENGISVQISNGGLLAAKTSLPVINDFRTIDVGLGGNGAPLAPFIDKILFSDYDFAINLGGIANISYQTGNKVIGFDVCACNQILNWLASLNDKDYDENGQMASKGNIDPDLLSELLTNQYSQFKYPKSLDNDWITQNIRPIFSQSNATTIDKLRTAVEWICIEIDRSITMIDIVESQSGQDRKCLCSGGGAKNAFLMEKLKLKFNQQNIQLVQAIENIVEFKEAMLMALLGYCRKNNLVNTFKDVTGASVDSIGGAIYQGIKNRI